MLQFLAIIWSDIVAKFKKIKRGFIKNCRNAGIAVGIMVAIYFILQSVGYILLKLILHADAAIDVQNPNNFFDPAYFAVMIVALLLGLILFIFGNLIFNYFKSVAKRMKDKESE